MKKAKRFFSGLVACICLVGAICFSASAQPAVASKAAGEFGTLTGTLRDSYYEEIGSTYFYEFGFETRVSRLPGASCKLYATVETLNNSTGQKVTGTTYNNPYQSGDYETAGYVDAYRIPNNKSITFAVYGNHECRYTNAYVVYTSKTYNWQRDHG